MPQKPASASALTMSQGYCSSRSIAAARGRATVSAKARARACSAICRGKGRSPCRDPYTARRRLAMTGAGRAASLQVNHSLGLTFYCSEHAAGPSPSDLLAFAATVAAVWRCRRPAARPPATKSPARSPSRARRSTDAEWRRRARNLRQPLPRQSQRRRGRHRLCPGAARHRPARAGGGGAGAGLDPQSAQHAAARRLWPRAGRCRRIHRSARRARPRPHAGQSGLAHPQRARRRARPDGPPRRGAAPLRDRAQDRAERAVGPVQSRPVLRARQEPAAAPRRRCGRRPPGPMPGPRCGRTSRWWSACRAASPKPRRSPAPTCRPTKPPPMSPICGRCSRSENDWKKMGRHMPVPDAGT